MLVLIDPSIGRCPRAVWYDLSVALYVLSHKGSAPRAADAARYACAKKKATKTCKGSRKKRPMIWCEQRIDNAESCLCRANCLVLSVLCAYWRCHLLMGSTGVICVGEKTWGPREIKYGKSKKKEYAITRIPGTAVCSKESTARHDPASQRRATHDTAPHRTALRCAAGLYIPAHSRSAGSSSQIVVL